MKIGIIGAGRIGKVHARNISMFVPELEIKTIADPFANETTAEFAKKCGIPNVTKDANDILMIKKLKQYLFVLLQILILFISWKLLKQVNIYFVKNLLIMI